MAILDGALFLARKNSEKQEISECVVYTAFGARSENESDPLLPHCPRYLPLARFPANQPGICPDDVPAHHARRERLMFITQLLFGAGLQA